MENNDVYRSLFYALKQISLKLVIVRVDSKEWSIERE